VECGRYTPFFRHSRESGNPAKQRACSAFAPAVHLLASQRNGTLYVGVTSDLISRLHQHRQGLIPGLTLDYAIRTLVWFEMHATMDAAILREKRIKSGTPPGSWS
jgi:predicted GIY-YIG superfamily endonuclease